MPVSAGELVALVCGTVAVAVAAVCAVGAAWYLWRKRLEHKSEDEETGRGAPSALEYARQARHEQARGEHERGFWFLNGRVEANVSGTWDADELGHLSESSFNSRGFESPEHVTRIYPRYAANTGLRREDIVRWAPTWTPAVSDIHVSSRATRGSEWEQICAICLDSLSREAGGSPSGIPFVAVTLCRQLVRCGHAFHARCLECWLQQANRCPICQQSACPESELFAVSRSNQHSSAEFPMLASLRPQELDTLQGYIVREELLNDRDVLSTMTQAA
ncbi:putative RING-H2 finger protein ATL12 [Porphyridium purpureum]|uniref:Putative RING-H2 finger protein ATL12 n=1 Tax=Porphyridium purpureum TaxID=35688 RepID=A0A5J4YS10_PORPP|nr:putative RING-H2 finger protein ATL12 [Porphyridium purpureum]|eukprot:POR7070..scf236_6